MSNDTERFIADDNARLFLAYYTRCGSFRLNFFYVFQPLKDNNNTITYNTTRTTLTDNNIRESYKRTLATVVLLCENV